MLSPGMLQDVGLSRDSTVCTNYASTAGSTLTWLLVEIDFNNSLSVQSTLLEVVTVLLMLRSVVVPQVAVEGGLIFWHARVAAVSRPSSKQKRRASRRGQNDVYRQ